MSRLLHSHAFWTAFSDFAVKIILIVLQRFYPEQIPLFNSLWLAAQPLMILVIAAFTVDDIERRLVAHMAFFSRDTEGPVYRSPQGLSAMPAATNDNGRITLAVVVNKIDNLTKLIGDMSNKLDRECDSTDELKNWQSAAEVKLNYLDKKSNLWDVGNTIFGGIALVIGIVFGTRKI